MRIAPVLVGLALAASACGTADTTSVGTTSVGPSTSSTGPTTATTSMPTSATTAPPTTTATPTTAEPPATTAAITSPTSGAPSDSCPAGVGVGDRRSDGFPGRLSSLVGTDARVGRHPCYDRFVLEMGGTGAFPGWFVRYVALPVTDSPRGEPVALPGTAAIVVTAEVWMPTMEGQGYAGPRSLTVSGLPAILAVEQVENFEGMTSWALALDRRRPFAVTTLADPPRLVVDVLTGTPAVT